jgi:formylglycine-generating enzyme required for sulfatase activity
MARVVCAAILLLAVAACGTAPKHATAFKECPTCPEMVAVPGGTFQMGRDHVEAMQFGEMRTEGPVRTVTIQREFAAGKYEVTNAEFAAFIAATGYVPSRRCQVWSDNKYFDTLNWRNPDYGRPPLPREPVVCVTWHDAKAYVAWLAKVTGKPYRLLSEAEWEYAARGGVSTKWPWGESDAAICRNANILEASGMKEPRSVGSRGNADPDACDDRFTLVSPVGSYAPNAYGLYDMIGNVWEWTEDCSVLPYPPGPVDGLPVEVQGACEKRAIRGGSWRTRLSRQSLTFRGRDPEPTASHIFGFRVARDLR